MDKKALIALFLCGIIMLYFFNLMKPPEQSGEKGPEEVAEKTIEQGELKDEIETEVVAHDRKVVEIVENDAELQDYILLQNDVMRSVWTNEGAALKSVILPEFKNPEKTETLELLKSSKPDSLPISVELADDKSYQSKTRRYKVIEKGPDKVVFAALLENGIQITKEISLKSGNYYFDVAISLQNTTDSEIRTSYSITAANGIYPEVNKTSGLSSIVGIDVGKGKTKIAHTDIKDMPYKNESVGITLAGSTNKYFAVALKPQAGCRMTVATSELIDNPDPVYIDNKSADFTVELHTTKIAIPPQGEKRHDYIYFLGPKETKALNQCEDLLSILDYDYGMMRSICKILVKILNTAYGVIPNYGVAILVLTFLVKLVLFPLTRKSQMSMVRMQQLQPLIGQLKEKHKGDKQKMGKEQMKLFKEHGVNPMSGCLPMMLQMPVFFALFRTLQSSFEMRQAPFVAWIGDLSAPDQLFQLPFTLPVIGGWLNILPILMGIASFIQMKLTPKNTAGDDPQAKMQQRMMQMMPLLFPIMLYNFASGLALYWTTSTIISIGEQILIRRSVKKLDIYYKGKRVIDAKAKVKK
ncbi:preprotein translocase subunit YidC [Candidatus Scalindua japonica]|uniref:Membrane protein insertase YidC n=1 Tax=Candidatus Scalindua japonica TaxID=1284222 RepID=A0A286TW46_9BACT|nr:membrane protein insertase YidC [Candidatus Scalindua japonica]GAX60110.1 preprotein translocase subunit YidC [Candidatus Scalindua japonica]